MAKLKYYSVPRRQFIAKATTALFTASLPLSTLLFPKNTLSKNKWSKDGSGNENTSTASTIDAMDVPQSIVSFYVDFPEWNQSTAKSTG